jgi:hypothetical protein
MKAPTEQIYLTSIRTHLYCIHSSFVGHIQYRSQCEIWEGGFTLFRHELQLGIQLGGAVGSYANRIPSQLSVAGSACCCSHISLPASSRNACNSSCIFDPWKVNLAPFIHGLDLCMALSSSICLTACNNSRQKKGYRRSVNSNS